MINFFGTTKENLSSYRIQLVMTFQSYTFPIPMFFLSYESNEPGVYYRIPLFPFETETKWKKAYTFPMLHSFESNGWIVSRKKESYSNVFPLTFLKKNQLGVEHYVLQIKEA